MINLLFSQYNFNATWAKKEVSNYLKRGQRLTVIPFSFGREVRNQEDWQKYYGKKTGLFYQEIIAPFLTFGLAEEEINWLNYFTDSPDWMSRTIQESDVIFFTGGLPDAMMTRLQEKGLVFPLQTFQGVMVGSSAGAMIQLGDYHITPDSDYPEFQMEKGLNVVQPFDIDVHYEKTANQVSSIKQAQAIHGQAVYAITNHGGLLINEERTVTMLGEVHLIN